MLKATHTPTTGGIVAPSRRHLVGSSILAALSGVAFAGAVVLPDLREAADNPDAELIRLCAECDALQAKVDALWAGDRTAGMTLAESQAYEKAREIAQEPFSDAQDPLLHRICEMRATTPQGQAARVQTLLAWDKDPIWTHDYCWNSQLIGAIVRDLVGEA